MLGSQLGGGGQRPILGQRPRDCDAGVTVLCTMTALAIPRLTRRPPMSTQERSNAKARRTTATACDPSTYVAEDPGRIKSSEASVLATVAAE